MKRRRGEGMFMPEPQMAVAAAREAGKLKAECRPPGECTVLCDEPDGAAGIEAAAENCS